MYRTYFRDFKVLMIIINFYKFIKNKKKNAFRISDLSLRKALILVTFFSFNLKRIIKIKNY